MKFMLLVYVDEKGFDASSQTEIEQTLAAYGAYVEALRKAGVAAGMDRLQRSATAVTVRASNGKTTVVNGPYAETREQLGGYFIVDVPDLDTALTWASRCPGLGHGTVEVRPVYV